jgi:NAD(P)-dependent dehydrogenase (short-subunit alcohol dehydrogenase family)
MSDKKLAIITGGSKGLGKTLAEWLSTQGYDLIITARGADELAATATELTNDNTSIHTLVGDVSDANHRENIAKIVQNYGQLDLLFNNASTLGTLPMPSLNNFDLDALATVFQINVIAPVALLQALLPYLKAGNGLIVNLTSDAAVGGYAGWGGYGASKAALELISRTWANELADEGVFSVIVDPGDMRTEMHQDAFPDEDISDRPLPDVTLPFWGWLLGQERRAINGQRYQAQSELWEVKS